MGLLRRLHACLAWRENPTASNPLCGNSLLTQEFSRDLLYIPKRGTCLEDDDLRGDENSPPWASRAHVSLLSVDYSCSVLQRVLAKPYLFLPV